LELSRLQILTNGSRHFDSSRFIVVALACSSVFRRYQKARDNAGFNGRRIKRYGGSLGAELLHNSARLPRVVSEIKAGAIFAAAVAL